MALPQGTYEILDDIPAHVWKGLPDSMKLGPSAVNPSRIGEQQHGWVFVNDSVNEKSCSLLQYFLLDESLWNFPNLWLWNIFNVQRFTKLACFALQQSLLIDGLAGQHCEPNWLIMLKSCKQHNCSIILFDVWNRECAVHCGGALEIYR